MYLSFSTVANILLICEQIIPILKTCWKYEFWTQKTGLKSWYDHEQVTEALMSKISTVMLFASYEVDEIRSCILSIKYCAP